MPSLQWNSLLILTFVISVCSQGPRVPDPLPAITPPDVVNILFEDSDDAPGDLVASVVGADSTAATYLIECATTSSCGYGAWESPIIVTQGLNTMHWTYSDSEIALSEWCTFDGTTASTAICTNSYPNTEADAFTTETPFTTMTYDGVLLSNMFGGPSFIGWPTANGPPPFIPVKITAGLASLSVFRNAATATGSTPASTSTSGSSSPTMTSKTGSQSQATTSPSITSLAKSTNLASSSSSSGSASAAASTTTKANAAGRTIKRSWGLGAAFAVLFCLVV